MSNVRGQSNRAFTLVELLLVMFIIALLATTGAPLFSRFVQGSRVQQGVAAVESALFHARSEAQNLRLQVAVYYGDDLNGMVATPNPVPPKGSIEVWSVRGSSGYGSFGGYGQTIPLDPTNANPGWYPFRFTVKLINKQPITLPANVRVIAGRFRRVWSGSGYDCIFDFPAYRKDNIGEIKRHHTAFSQRGGMARNDCNYAYNHLLIFDETSGEHVIMEAGRCQTATRPRTMPYVLTKIGGTKLTDFRQIGKLIDSYPGNM